ncbi:MAG: Ig-like domain-containing protein [Clostridia bacterium]
MSRIAKWALSISLVSSMMPWNIASAESEIDLPILKTGTSFSVAVKPDGSVWTWGRNYEGQLGDGTTTSSNVPTKLKDLSNVTDIAVGYAHVVALDEKQRVWAWGDNTSGQVGNGNTTKQLKPTQIKDHIVSVAAAQYHSAAIDDKGKLYTWGDNTYGQLGDGTTGAKTTPMKVSGLDDVIDVSTGYLHTSAVTKDGTVYSWGFNGEGNLGDGTWNNSKVPVQVKGLDNVVDLESGWRHTLALKSNGTVWSWGRGGEGQLGDGTLATQNRPVQVAGLKNIVAIATGYDNSFAVQSDGTLWAWGSNLNGKLGDGTTSKQSKPIKINGLPKIADVAAANSHTIAVDEEGTAWVWGTNAYGAFGNGDSVDSSTPIKIKHYFLIESFLRSLKLSDGTLSPAFRGKKKQYTASVANSVETISLKPTAFGENATIDISLDGKKLETVTSGKTSEPIKLQVGVNKFQLDVQAPENSTTYKLEVTREQGNQAPIASDLKLSTTVGTELKGTLQAKDAENDKLTYTIFDNSSKGTVKLTEDRKGDFVYIPDKGATGTDTFTYKANDGNKDSNIATVTISIVEPAEAQLVVSEENLLLQPKKTAALKVYYMNENGKKEDITSSKLTKYATSDSKIATVSKGKVKAGSKEGEATITITYKDLELEVGVKVSKQKVTKLTPSTRKVTLEEGETDSVELKAAFTNKEEADVTDLATWISNDPKVVTVENGELKAVGKGKASVKAIYGGKNVVITVTVTEKKPE